MLSSKQALPHAIQVNHNSSFWLQENHAWDFLGFCCSPSSPLLLLIQAHGNSDLIQKNMQEHEILRPVSDAFSRKADTKGLVLIMIRVGIANATATNSYLSVQMVSVPNDTSMKKVMQECADMYASANDSLQNSVQDFSMEMYDYAYLHVAAADDPNACHNAFNRYPGTSYPSELALREDGLKQICDVVLGIIDSLSLYEGGAASIWD